jgi:tetratricopeptide (TPR) repeat protein
MRYYRTAIQVEPDSPLACKLLGRIQMGKGEYSEAIQTFKRAGRLAQLDPQPDFFEGLAYTRIGNATDQAIECFSRSLKLNPELPDGYFWLGSLYFHRKHEFKLAEKYLEEAVRRVPNWPAANQVLIQCYRMLGEDRKAADQVVRYREAASQSPPVFDLRAFLDTQR